MNFLKKYLKRIFEFLGFRVKRVKHLSWGEDIFVDLSKLVDLRTFKIVFDIGANVGQSCSAYLTKFSSAHIFSFEPVHSTYTQLLKKFAHNERVTPVHSAMGKEPGQATIYLNARSTLNSLNLNRNLAKSTNSRSEEIVINSIDVFCDRNKIDSIDFLKIDTEGFEQEVLLGAMRMLNEGRVKFILLELGIKKMTQTTFYQDVHAHLTDLGFEVLAFYKQSQSLYSEERFVMHCDVLFVNQVWSRTLVPEFIKIGGFNNVIVK